MRTASERAAVGYEVIWWLALTWLSLLVLGGIGGGFLREDFFSSDHLYIPALLDDMMRWGGSLHDWRLTPAPYFLPDMPLYGVWRLLGAKLEWAQYFGGLSLLLLLVWATRSLIEAALGVNAFAAPVAALVFVCAMMLQMCGVFSLVQPLFILSNHGGAAWASVVTLAWLLRARPSRRWSLMIFAFAFVSGWADPLFAASCGAPIALIGMYVSIDRRWRRVRTQAAVKPIQCLGVGVFSVLGAEVTRVMQVLLSDVRIEAHPEMSALSWSRLIDDLLGPARGELLLFCSSWLLSLFTLWFLRGRAETAKLRIVALFQLLSSCCAFGAVICAGNYVDLATLRYVVVPFTFSLALMAAVLAGALGRTAPESWTLRVPRLLVPCIAVGLAISLGWQGGNVFRGQYASNERATSDCVEAVSLSNATDVVLAGYWFAKPLMMFSPDQMKVLQMKPDMKEPYWWINSRSWYRGAHAFGVIATNGLDTQAIRKSFGKPHEVTHCGEVELYVYAGRPRLRLQQTMQHEFERFVRAAL